MFSMVSARSSPNRAAVVIAEGRSNRQIAQALFLAEGTVKNYVSRIMEKLHANTRTQLAIRSRSQRRESD